MGYFDQFPGPGISSATFGYPFRGSTFWFEDFLYTVSVGAPEYSATADLAKYRLGGTGTTIHYPAFNLEGGVAAFITGATDNNEASYQLNGSAFFLKPVSGSQPAPQMRFQCRAALANAAGAITTNTFYFGLWAQLSSTTAILTPVTGTQPVGIGFVVTNGAVGYESKVGSTATTATAIGYGNIAAQANGGTLATADNATFLTTNFHTYTMEMDQNNVFSFWVDGVKYLSTTTNVPLSTTVGLSPIWGIKTTGASTAKALLIDYIGCQVEGPVGGR